MTLAVIFLSCLLPTPSKAAPAQISSQSAPATKPADATSAQDQGTAQQQSQPAPPQPAPPKSAGELRAESQPAQGQGSSPQQNPPQPSPAAPSTSAPNQKPSATAGNVPLRPRHKRRVPSPNCNPAPASGTAPATGDPNAASKPPADSSATGTTATAAKPPASANCPPSKVVVRQGGTSEPSIQLVGGATGSPDRDKANEMLQAAEQNLKKITGRQLSSSQRDMVTQVRQFMDQSKNATASGDLDRARTLAWKAQLLSEELAHPEQ
jgi:hypothetical protein